MNYILNINYEILTANTDYVVSLLISLRREANFSEIRSRIKAHLESLKNDKLSPLKKNVMRNLKRFKYNFWCAFVRDAISAHYSLFYEIKRRFIPFYAVLDDLPSDQHLTIINNVSRAIDMTIDDIIHILVQECSMYGTLITSVDMKYWIKCISDNYIYDPIKHHQQPPFEINESVTTLEAYSLAFCLENSRGFYNELFGSPMCIAFYITQPENSQKKYLPNNIFESTNLPFPMFDRYVTIKDPFEINWLKECNLPNVAVFRIALRSTIAKSAKYANHKILPTNYTLSVFLVHGILCLLEQLVRKFPKVPSSQDFNNPNCRFMRGLMGLLFTLTASGHREISMLWRLVSDEAIDVVTLFDWECCLRFIKCYAYTCWNINHIVPNIKRLLRCMLGTSLKSVVPNYSEILIKDVKYVISLLFDNFEQKLTFKAATSFLKTKRTLPTLIPDEALIIIECCHLLKEIESLHIKNGDMVRTK